MQININFKKIYTSRTLKLETPNIEAAFDLILSKTSSKGAKLCTPQENLGTQQLINTINQTLNKYDCLETFSLLLFISMLALQIRFSDKFMISLLQKTNNIDTQPSYISVFFTNWFISWSLNHQNENCSLEQISATFSNLYSEDYLIHLDHCLDTNIELTEKSINNKNIGSVEQCAMVAMTLLFYQGNAAAFNLNAYISILEKSPHYFSSYVLELYNSKKNIQETRLSTIYRLSRKYPLDSKFSDLFNLKGKLQRLNNDITALHNVIEINTSALNTYSSKVHYAEKIIKHARKEAPTKELTFITSMFKGDQWIKGFLQNLTSLRNFSSTEVLLISANSPGNEFLTIQNYLDTFDNIYYIKLDFDPGLYEVWNIGCRTANSSLLSNANLDDRKASDFVNKHIEAFKFNDRISLVSAPCYISKTPEITVGEIARNKDLSLYYYSSPTIYSYQDFFVKYFDNENEDRIVIRNIPHCMPVWKKTLHDKYGYFNEHCGGPTADFEFWIRCASNGELFYNLNEPLGVYYYSDTTTYSARQKNSLDKVINRYIRELYI